MTLQQFINKYSGQTLGYPSGSYVGECLSLVKVYIQEMFGITPPASGSNSAYGYWANFPNPLPTMFVKVANTPSGIPKAGDIMIWNTSVGSGYGHIAIFVEGNANSFKSFDQNWGGKQAHIQGHYYTNVVGWLSPKINQGEIMIGEAIRCKTQTGATVWHYIYNLRYAFKSPTEFESVFGKEGWSKIKDVATLPDALDPELLQSQIKGFETTIKSLDSDNDTLKKKNLELENYLTKTEESQKTLTTKIDVLDNKVLDAETKIKDLADSLMKKSGELLDLQVKYNELKRKKSVGFWSVILKLFNKE